MPHIRSLSEFVARIAEIRRSWRDDEHWIEPWFRGHSDADWSLVPNTWRNGETFDLTTEYEFRDEFQRRGIQLIDGQRIPSDKWEWYFTLQHYRGRTRLLDWTDAALVALYFGVSGNTGKTHAAVWALDPFWFNKHYRHVESVVLSTWDDAAPYLPDLHEVAEIPRHPIAIDPPHVTARFSVQHSHFTLHGGEALDLRELASVADSRLIPITIHREAMIELRRDLRACGLVETSIYPDLEGLARELTQVYATEWIEEEASKKRGGKRRTYRNRH